MIDAVFGLCGLDEMKSFKLDELTHLENALGIELDARRMGFLDGFYVRPLNPTLTTDDQSHMTYLEGFGAGAAARREINSKYKEGGRL